ncbi:DUF5753 domain-containing protein [Nocardia wallacei]|uniref:DUF5753 domain-containing protein n=1 Tax=Nocardia wallacei TaxID=480035 RepID=UPI0024590873|nr:DUF5753 domain-containing protein [Nocardia wallacei]
MTEMSPTVAQWDLVLRIKLRSKELGISGPQIVKALSVSTTYWSQVMNYHGVLTEAKLHLLLDLLEFAPDEQDELLGLRAHAKERGWWSRYSAILSDDALRLYGLESGASSIRVYESVVIPGLLQSEEYAHALIASDLVADVRKVDVKKFVEVRMLRQQRLGHADLHFVAVIGQAALLQQNGGPAVLKRQLAHLASVIENNQTTVDIRVIPFTATSGSALGGATFYLLDFASSQLPTVAWHESAAFGELSDNEKRVEGLGVMYAKAQDIALSQADTLALIKKTAGEIS